METIDTGGRSENLTSQTTAWVVTGPAQAHTLYKVGGRIEWKRLTVGTRTSPFRLRINDELAYKVTVMSRRMSRRRLGPAGYLKHRRRRRSDTRLMTEGLTPRTSRPGDRLTGPTEWIAFLVYRIYYHNFSLIASYARGT